jgi:eukaryotic-like serine/threonine-protein kinase
MLSDRVLHHLRTVIDAPFLEGTRYEVIEEIGRGGMGVVYLARDTVLGRKVALKILNRPEEARILASLEHPGIVPVHDAGALPDGRTFYAMKFVEGTRLDTFCETAPSLSDRMRVFVRICEPVAFAHSRNVIHRDLKPENVMIGAFGEVLVLDWGIAGRMGASVTTIGGTKGYIAPEQSAGITSPQTDIYSLGKVLEYLLTPRDPKPAIAIAAKAAHPDPQLRYSSVVELAEDAMRFLDSYAVLAYHESLFERGARWISRNKTLAVLILTYILVRAAIFFLAKR